MNNKKFYWIKLKTEFFNQDTIDFLLSQKNGCEYIVLYQMLCLKTANNGGELTTNVGEMIIPYDIDKIVRDCKYFDTDTVMIALELFKKLNLIYEEKDKILRITDIDEMVGSETKYAIKQRTYRENKLPELPNKLVRRINREMLSLPNGKTKYIDEKRYGGNGALAMDLAGVKCEICGCDDTDSLVIHHNNGYSNNIEDLYILCSSCHGKVESGGYTLSTHKYTNLSTQEIENRDKSIDIDNIKKESIKKDTRFIKPSIEEIEQYCIERNNGINANAFYDFYESKNWYVGKNKMKDWKAAIRTWENRSSEKNKKKWWEEDE